MSHHRSASSLLTLLLLIISTAATTSISHWNTVSPDPTGSATPSSSSFVPPLTDASWNPAVSCLAVITTVEQVLGTQYNTTTGGALYSGGGFRPGIPGKRSLSPPCTAGTPPNATFVEFRNVTMAGSTMTIEDCSTSYAQGNGGGPFPNGQNCDLTRNLFDPAGPRTPNVLCSKCMSGLFVEIDRDWNASAVAPPMIGVNGTKEKIDVQGFLYWNPNELDQAWHLYSGWELHPLTAWRRSSGSAPDYYLSNKRLMTVPTGSSNSVTVYLGSINGFQGTVSTTISASGSGPSANLDKSNVLLTATGWGSSARLLLTVSAQGVAPGAYLVTVVGASGLIIHESRITVLVTNPDFTISATPDSAAMQLGASANFTITVTSINGFQGTLALSAFSPAGATSTVNPSSVTLSSGGNATSILTVSIGSEADAGVHSVVVGVTDGIRSHSAVVLVQVLRPPPTQGFDISASPGSLFLIRGQTGHANITVTSINSFSGMVSFSLSIYPLAGLSCSLNPVNVTLVSQASTDVSCSGVAGAYNVLASANSGNTTRAVNMAVTVIEPASLSATPQSLVIDAGATGSSIITVSNFASALSLAVSWTPRSGLSCSLDTDSLTSEVDAGLLSCNGVAGAYVVTVAGTNGSLTASTTVTFVVEDFSLAALPSSVTVISGSSATAMVTATSLNGFNRTVILSRAVSPKQGLNCSLTPASFSLDTSATSRVECSGSPGMYSVKVTAASGSLSHAADLSIAMSDFSLFPSELAVTVRAGDVENQTFNVTSLFGFQGQVSLSAISPAAGLDVSVSPQTVSLSGQNITAVLTVRATTSLQLGSYSFVVVATDEPTTHSLNVAVTVVPPGNASPFVYPLVLWLTVAVTAVATVSMFALFRRRRSLDAH